MSYPDAYEVQLGDRGRLVLPAEIRRRLELRQGDELRVTVEGDGSVRLASVRPSEVGLANGLQED